MPRSNKKKSAFKPPPKHPTSQQIREMETEGTIVSLMTDERDRMMKGAICSAKHNGINLVPSLPTSGLGDCAFEAAISNINERN